MKITFTPTNSPEQDNEGKFKPYVCKCGDNYVLVTGKGENERELAGIMLNNTSFYQPFEFQSMSWNKKFLIPFHGTITIECP